MAKKATVKITGIDKARDAALKFLASTKGDKSILNELGQVASDQIRGRTRSRLEEYKQPPLKPATIDRRKALISYGNFVSEKVSKPSQSNLSLSGQLLDAVKYRINVAEATVTLFVERFRLPYAGKRKPYLENKKDNVEIKDDLEKAGRKFFFISDKLQAQLESRIAAALKKKLSLYNKIRAKLR